MTRDMNRDSNSDQTPLGPILRAPGVGPTLDVLGVPHIYKAKANDTGQQFSVWESIVPPGAGTPAHTPFDAANKRAGQRPAVDTLASIAAQHGVVIHPPAQA